MDDVLRNALGELLKAVTELLDDVKALQTECKKLGLADAGEKADLVARLAENGKDFRPLDFNDDDSVRWQAILQLQEGMMQLLEDSAFKTLLGLVKSESMSRLKACMYEDEERREATKLEQRNNSVYLSVNQAWRDLQVCVGDMDDCTNAIFVPSNALQVRRLPL